MIRLSPEYDNAKNVEDLKYMKYLRYQLYSNNMWPKKVNGNETIHKCKTYYLLSQSVILWTGGVVFVYNNIRKLSFFEMGHSYITCSMNIVYLSRTWLALLDTYKKLMTDFITKIHLFHFKHRSAYAMETHIAIHKISYGFTIYMIAIMTMGMILFNATPMFKNYLSGAFSQDPTQNSTIKYEHAVYYSFPFNADTSLKGYIFLNILNWYACYLVTVSFCIMDLLLFLIIFHVCGHFRILLHELETFPRPQLQFDNKSDSYRNMKFSSEELPFIREKLKECITYHTMLKSFVQDMSNVFGTMLFVYNLFHSAVGCLLLLECSRLNPEALTRYGPLTLIIFQQLIQMSSIIELVTTSSEKLLGAVYNLPWEYMDKRNSLTVLIFLLNVQEPVRVKAQMVNLGVTNMAAILKTTFSYFTFLRTVAE